MSVTNVEQTYGDATIKTDVVLNSVEILSAVEDGIFAKLEKTKAIAMVHSYSVDSLATPGSLAVQQGADFSYAALTTPSLLSNIVQEVARPIRVTRPQVAVEHYHGQNELERQTAKALMDFTNGAEFDLVRSTLVSGVSGTVAKMSGIIQAISKSTNTTAHTSGTVLSASILDGLMQDNWTNSNGQVATDLYVGGLGKRVIDGFTAKTNVVVNSPDIRGLVKTVTTYETSMGTLSIHKHRLVDIQGTDATLRLLGIRPEKLKVAFLERPTILDNLTVGGAYMPRAVYSSMTLEVRNQDSNFFTSGFLRSA
jgi:hypothetical protein